MTEKTESGPIRQHERTDINTKYVAAFAAILVCVTLALYAVTWLMFDQFAPEGSQAQPKPAPESNPPLFPAPRLQVDPQGDLEQLRKNERALLGSYGWVDRDAGIVRIPIDRAIDIVGEKGLPDFGKPNAGGVTK